MSKFSRFLIRYAIRHCMQSPRVGDVIIHINCLVAEEAKEYFYEDNNPTILDYLTVLHQRSMIKSKLVCGTKYQPVGFNFNDLTK